jgi:hypothetical protein
MDMHTDFSVFRERLAEACRVRNMTHSQICRNIGLGGRRAVEFHVFGAQAVDIYRLCQIADALQVSLDWLLGRMDEMELPKRKAAKRSPAA